MAHPRRDQEHLGVDTNVLVAYLDADHPAHRRAARLSHEAVALNPTIVLEAYHTLVFKMKWSPDQASKVLIEACTDERNLFINQTLTTAKMGLRVATRYGVGGRDALILANLLTARIAGFVTMDDELIALRRVAYGSLTLVIRPL
jgi:predicted nucleic acid-binding protein